MTEQLHWTEGFLYGFDVETTGVDPEEDRIVTAALIRVGGGEDPVKRTWLLNPGVFIPLEATEIHGVTTRQARDEGMDAAAGILEIRDALKAIPAGCPIIAFNARFDLTMLDRECRRHDLEPLHVPTLLVFDPLIIDKHLERYRSGPRQLNDVVGYWGADVLETPHDALADATAACRVAYRQGRRGQVVRRSRNPREAEELLVLANEWSAIRDDLGKLHEAQRRWSEEDARELAAYFREKRKPPADRAVKRAADAIRSEHGPLFADPGTLLEPARPVDLDQLVLLVSEALVPSPDDVDGNWPVKPVVSWECSCGERDISKRYGGEADHDNAPDSPCERCIEQDFAAHG